MIINDYYVKGSHAERIRFLSQQANKNESNEKNGFGLFAGGISIYILAPIIGVLKNKKADENMEGNHTYRIHPEAFITNSKKVEMIFRLVLLSEENNLSNDEKINRAFKSDKNPNINKANMDLFHSYLRGGIDWLYEKILDNNATLEDDYIANLLEMVEAFSEEYRICDE